MDINKLGPPSSRIEIQPKKEEEATRLWWIEMDKLLKSLGKPPMDMTKMQTPGKTDPILNDPNFMDRVQGVMLGHENQVTGKQRSTYLGKGDRQNSPDSPAAQKNNRHFYMNR